MEKWGEGSVKKHGEEAGTRLLHAGIKSSDFISGRNHRRLCSAKQSN